MLAHRLGDRAEDDAGLGQFLLEGRADRDRIEDRIHRHLPRGIGHLGALDAGEDRLLLQRNAELLVGLEQLGIDLVQRLRLHIHALRLGVIVEVLIVDLGIIEHRPPGLFHLHPAAVGLKPPLGHPLRLVVLPRDQPHDVLVQPLGREVHLDLGFPAVLVLAGHRLDRLDRLTVDAVANLGNRSLFQCCHRSQSPFQGHGPVVSLVPPAPDGLILQAARARWRSRARIQASANRRASPSVTPGPSERRSAEPASSSPSPIARRTRLARTLPDEQADPAETAKPARSICITCVSPFQPGVTRQSVFGSRGTSFPTEIVPFPSPHNADSRIFLS